MARIVQIEKADPTYKGHQIEDVEIRIHKSIIFEKKRSIAVLVISTPDLNEAIAAFVQEAGIRKEDAQHG